MAEKDGTVQYDKLSVEGVTVFVPQESEAPTEPQAEVPPTTPSAAPRVLPLTDIRVVQPPRVRNTDTPTPPLFPARGPRSTPPATALPQIPPRRVGQAPAPGLTPFAPQQSRAVVQSFENNQPPHAPAAGSAGKERGRGIFYGGLALVLAIGGAATYGLTRDGGRHQVNLRTEAGPVPGPATATATPKPIDKPEALPEKADLSFLSADNVEPDTPAAAPPSQPTKDKKSPSAVVPNVFPTTPESSAPQPSPHATRSSTPSSTSSSTTHENTPSPTTTAEQTPTGEVRLPAMPSVESIEALNASVSDEAVNELGDKYKNFEADLNLEDLARGGKLEGLNVDTIEHNQQLITAVYAIPGVKQQLGQPNTVSLDSLRAMQQSGTSPAATLNAHPDTLIRNASSLYPQTGDAIINAAVINDRLAGQLIDGLKQGKNLWVPNADNARVVKVQTAQLRSNVTIAFAATFAEYQYNDHRDAELRWSVLQPVNTAGDFVATTVFSQTLDEKKPAATETTSSTPTDTYTSDATSTPDTTTTSESSSHGDGHKSEHERRKNRNHR